MPSLPKSCVRILRRGAIGLTFAVAALLIAGSGCVTPGTGQQINVLSTAEEIEIGKKMSAEVEQSEDRLDNTAVQAYVRRIGERIAGQSPRKDVPYEFTVIDNDDVVNAFALPGGHMYIYTGLMKLCDNEAQLASVMAHEIGHVAAHHHGETLTREMMIERVREFMLGPKASAATAAGGQVLAQLFQLKFSKIQEQEADRLGMDILFRAGYKPEAMVDFMRKLAQYEDSHRGGQRPNSPGARFLTNLLSSHPAALDRVAYLETLLQTYPVELRNQSPTYFDRYRKNVLDVLK